MRKLTKPDFSDLENDLLRDAIKSVSSQFVCTLLGKLYAKIEKMSTF